MLEHYGPREFAARLARTALFEGLKEEALLAIARHARLRSLRKSQVLWKQGDRVYELASVWEGQLDVVRRVGGNVTFRAVKKNELIGVSSAMGLLPCGVDVIAIEATRVLLVPGEPLRLLVPEHPEIAFRALEYMGALLGQTSDDVQLLHRAPLEQRVIRRLRILGAGRVQIVIKHDELAEQVGARRESVSRVLSELEQRGVLRCRRGRIDILNLDVDPAESD